MKVTDEKTRIRILNPLNGSKDPDPYKNATMQSKGFDSRTPRFCPKGMLEPLALKSPFLSELTPLRSPFPM